MSDTLKHCPFCGSNELTRQISTPDREGVPVNVMCMDCGTSGPWVYCSPPEIKNDGEIPMDAIMAWNRRRNE